MVRIYMIILNTLSRAVSEYSDQGFQSITPTHAGAATGLFVLGGDKDGDQPIVANIQLPSVLSQDTLKKHIRAIYVSVKSSGNFDVNVFGNTQKWKYAMPVLSSGQSRCIVGKGIRENYLGFGLSNPAGQHFKLDRIEVLEAASTTRRV